MMKALLVMACLCAAGAMAARPGRQAYTTQYDGVDLPAVLNNDRLRKGYLDCLVKDGSRCTPDAQVLKEAIPDALTNECAKCSEQQKAGTKQVLQFLRNNKPDELKLLTDKFDPKGLYRKRYEQQIKQLDN